MIVLVSPWGNFIHPSRIATKSLSTSRKCSVLATVSATNNLAPFRFFVATAAKNGHVNVSPKGQPGSFVVLGPQKGQPCPILSDVVTMNVTQTAAHFPLHGH